jgi:hypothetical protein
MARSRQRTAKSSASRLVGRRRFTRPGKFGEQRAVFGCPRGKRRICAARQGIAGRLVQGQRQDKKRDRNTEGRLAILVKLANGAGDQFSAERRVQVPRFFRRPIDPRKIPVRLRRCGARKPSTWQAS